MAEITLNDIAAFLNAYFAIEAYGADEADGIYRPSERPIQRIGIALEPWPELPAWAEAQQLDALFLHRPWKLDALLASHATLTLPNTPPSPTANHQSPITASQSPIINPKIENQKSKIENLGVLAYHLPFDEYLTPGDSPRLADALLLSNTEVLGTKDGRPLGMIGDIAPQLFLNVLITCNAIFGGYEEAATGSAKFVTRLAVVGAMTPELVREAGERGAQVYLTGQFRVPARSVVSEWGMGVIAIGHRRSELWGLRALAGLLRDRFALLEVIVAPN